IDAIEDVCATGLDIDILDGVTSLVGKSLVQRHGSTSGNPRFHMLETIREYAGHKLSETAESEQIPERHADYFLKLAEDANTKLRGPHSDIWLDRLEEEHNNLRAVLEWSLRANAPRGEQRMGKGLRLAGALGLFWDERGYFGEGRQWCTLLLHAGSAAGPRPATATGLWVPAHMTWQLGDALEARSYDEESLEMFRALGDDRGFARVVYSLGSALMWEGEYDKSLSHYEETLALGKKLGDRRLIASALSMTGVIL